MLEELVNALAFILFIEGALYALFPESMRKLAQRIENASSSSLRTSGIFAAVCGVGIIWLMKN